jgi:hypothetical protein
VQDHCRFFPGRAGRKNSIKPENDPADRERRDPAEGGQFEKIGVGAGVTTEELTELVDFCRLEEDGMKDEGSGETGIVRVTERGLQQVENVKEIKEGGETGKGQLQEDKGFLAVLHLSALSFLLFPGFPLLPAMGIFCAAGALVIEEG